jgi:two-component sensor histidine kinase
MVSVFELGPSVVNPIQGLSQVHRRSRGGTAAKGQPHALGVVSDERGQQYRVIVEPLLRWFALDPALAATARPVHVIVEKLARAVGADGAYVGQLLDLEPGSARTIAWWRDGRHAESVRYRATESPYQGMPRISLVTHPLTSLDGELIGHIGVVRRDPWKGKRAVKRLLATCASRVAGEVERLRRESVVQGHDGVHAPETGGREPQSTESVREGETLLREVHHRVKNNLQIVASLLTMQAGAASDGLVRQALSDAVTRISTIALIHAQLCEGPKLSSVDMRPFVHELVNNVRRTFSDSSTVIVTALHIDPLRLPLHVATPCGLLISELVTNAFQHAFVDAKRGTIEIQLTSDDRVGTLIVRDNGRGLPSNAGEPESRSLGLHLVRLLATRQLRGRVYIARDNGTVFTVKFPLGAHGPISHSGRRQRGWRAK